MSEKTPQLPVSEQETQIQAPVPLAEASSEGGSFWEKIQAQKKKIFIGLGVFIGVLILAGVVFGVYQYAQKQIPPESSEGPTHTLVATPTPDPTVDWETFISSHGYSIRLSPEMKIEETGMGRGKPEDAEGIRIYPSGASEPLQVPHMDVIVIPNSQLSLEQAAEDNYSKNINHKGIPATSVEKVHEGSFLGGGSYEYTLRNKGLVTPHEEYIGYEGEYKIIWTQKNSKLFAILFTKTPQFDLMLSTFKFLEEKWRTYKDIQYGFEASYPPDWEAKDFSYQGGIYNLIQSGVTFSKNQYTVTIKNFGKVPESGCQSSVKNKENFKSLEIPPLVLWRPKIEEGKLDGMLEINPQGVDFVLMLLGIIKDHQKVEAESEGIMDCNFSVNNFRYEISYQFPIVGQENLKNIDRQILSQMDEMVLSIKWAN